MGEWKLYRGDCREFLKTLPENSVDAVVTDPPYELNFMGREWDRTGIAFDPAFWTEVLRVLKPGAHLLAAGIGRMHHRMMVAVEDAGFEIRDCIYHIFGSGFPKNLDLSKAIDRLEGAERPVIGVDLYHARRIPNCRPALNVYSGPDMRAGADFKVTAPATEEAARWQGWGTALKPSVEIWVLARKPLAEKSVVENVLQWGTGAINIDRCRIVYRDNDSWHPGATKKISEVGPYVYNRGWSGEGTMAASPHGRWPANLVLSHAENCVKSCVPGCPVRLLDGQSGKLKSGFMRAGTERSNLGGYSGAMPALTMHDTYGDSGGASRFFYCAKVSRNERWGWCRKCSRVVLPEELDVHREERHDVVVHPTQKPLELMRWFVRLVTPPGGLVLDPFAGSGATLVAAVLEGFRCIGVEADPEYASIAEARVKAACGEKVSAAVLVGDGMEQLTFF
ncbi:DNA methylase [Desulfofundulus australicus DSM 11792]|uniref:Methyltransferase n=1 Tax=Desulfofundulus australicus DSM 11792 TaxID=1121425 RepID=A0A1M5DGH5_9FIRM|nr:site-specific DNA-methyltransferase [Desulfofundulus australicus]SHF66025.1 DNA methylase [Desulfofundulus australicus DSM 11792]